MSLDYLNYLFDAGTGADVQFLVGIEGEEKPMKAHKLTLRTASNVFEAMFRFDATNNASSVEKGIETVKVTDIEPEAFKIMLRFIYANGDTSELNGHNAMAVLIAANKYNISDLIEACIEFPIRELDNVFLAFALARLLGKEDFARGCLEHICENADELLQSEQFLETDQNSLCDILGQDQLKISGGEIAIWNAALRWADAKCRQNDMECSAANRRAVLGPALDKIRFPLIPKCNFSQIITQSGVLTNKELVSVYMSYNSAANPPDIDANSAQREELFPLYFPTERRANFAVEAPAVCKLEIENGSPPNLARNRRQVTSCNQHSTVLKGLKYCWSLIVICIISIIYHLFVAAVMFALPIGLVYLFIWLTRD